MLKNEIELLAPGGDLDSIKAAIAAGANAVYCGLDRFNARNSAANIHFDDLQGILRLAHQNHCEVFLTLNIIIIESEIPALIELLNKVTNTCIDGIIIQDLGLFYILSHYFKNLKIHASTQLTTHNEGQVRFLSHLNASRVNLSRELNINEIKALTTIAHQHQILTEVFVHGSYCLSFSGICYISSVHGGNSGNRGRCSQPCRDAYQITSKGNHFPLNLKDNSAYLNLKELAEAGVDSLKIEGRIKKYPYVFLVVESWRKQLQRLYDHTDLNTNNEELYQVFNRDFSNTFLTGTIHKNMFIDNPRDHSAIHRAEQKNKTFSENLELAKKEIHEERTAFSALIQKKIEPYHINKPLVKLIFSGESGTPLRIDINTPNGSWNLSSTMNLNVSSTQILTSEILIKRFKAINDTEYKLEPLNTDALPTNLSLPFKELTAMKKRALLILNDSRETVEPILIPPIKKQNQGIIQPMLSILIDSVHDIHLEQETTANLFFQLPSSFSNTKDEWIALFTKNKRLIPWFPSILIGDDYTADVEFLQQLNPYLIVTNNTGIAFDAFQRGIDWIAGPHLNVVNSFSLLCLKEYFNCTGAFISNELNQTQIRNIHAPENFKLYYSIYHPQVLMTSRQCFFHQTDGCKKDCMDATCLTDCSRSSSITNLKGVSFVIEKTKGNYNILYNQANFLNTDIVTDFPNTFSSLMIDLRHIKTETQIGLNSSELIHLFEKQILGNIKAATELNQMILPTMKTSYQKGI